MDASRVEGEAVQARRVVLGVVAVGVAEGQPPLVAPPHVHPGPVDDVDRRVIGEGRDEGDLIPDDGVKADLVAALEADDEQHSN